MVGELRDLFELTSSEYQMPSRSSSCDSKGDFSVSLSSTAPASRTGAEDVTAEAWSHVRLRRAAKVLLRSSRGCDHASHATASTNRTRISADFMSGVSS